MSQLSTTRTLCKRMSTSTSNLYVLCASDHDTEECLTLLVKIQEKRNQNNQNVQWISAEARDEG
jgi:hypothetical protein